MKRTSFWDREVHEPTHTGWMDPLPVRYYINERVSGDRHRWPLDWFERQYPRRFARALSIGCGTGALERDLVRRDIAASVDAFDASVSSISIARVEAAALGMAGRIRYFAADFNRPALPEARYDAIFMHQSLHHVGKLEKLLHAMLIALKPDGIVYLDEYVGPSRDEWDDASLDLYSRRYLTYDRSLRRVDELPPPIQPEDPTEAVRSGEIVDQLRVGFDIDAFRGYGGAMLSIIGPQLKLESAPDDVLEELIAADRVAVRDFYAVIVARPKSGAAKEIARIRYFTEPKVKRIGRELLALATLQRTRSQRTSAR